MDLLQDNEIFTFNIHYEDEQDSGKMKNYDTHAIIVDKEKRRVEPFKKLPVLVEDTDIDVGDLIIHSYGTKTPKGFHNGHPTSRTSSKKLEDTCTEDAGVLSINVTPGGGKKEKDAFEEISLQTLDAVISTAEDNLQPVISRSDCNTNENNNVKKIDLFNKSEFFKEDFLVELDSSFATSSEGSPKSTENNGCGFQRNGQLLGGNSRSISVDDRSLDLSLHDENCDFYKSSLISHAQMARHHPAPRFIAHQMALSISPERYLPKTRPKSNRYSISSASPSDDGSQFELWGSRKRNFNRQNPRTKLCIALLVALLIVIILCIIVIPIALTSIKHGDRNAFSNGINSTTESTHHSTHDEFIRTDNGINFQEVISSTVKNVRIIDHTTRTPGNIGDIMNPSYDDVTVTNNDITYGSFNNGDISRTVLTNDVSTDTFIKDDIITNDLVNIDVTEKPKINSNVANGTLVNSDVIKDTVNSDTTSNMYINSDVKTNSDVTKDGLLNIVPTIGTSTKSDIIVSTSKISAATRRITMDLDITTSPLDNSDYTSVNLIHSGAISSISMDEDLVSRSVINDSPSTITDSIKSSDDNDPSVTFFTATNSTPRIDSISQLYVTTTGG